jgi:tetratricopeptide (TPR) repeat protein
MPPSASSPLPISTMMAQGRRTAITFSEMEVAPALQIRFQTPSPEAVPSVADQMAIASRMVERPEDQAEIQRILAEADVFVKYGLVERAAEHLRRVFERVPSHVAAHERLAAVLVQLGRNTEAAAELETLSQQVFPSNRDEAAAYAKRALELNPGCKRAREVLAALERQADNVPSSPAEADYLDSPDVEGDEPELIDSREIEIVGEEATDPAASSDGAALGAAFGSRQPSPNAGRVSRAAAFDDGATNVFSKGAGPVAPAQPDLEGAVTADLEQVDFFMDQALHGEAQSLLDDMAARYPGHPRVTDRRERLARLAQGTGQGAVPQAQVGQAPFAAAGTNPGDAGTAGPQDLDTHADLALMNKTMERHDVAIQHFTALLADPAREVYALTMIGESQEALGNFAEAIRCYQDALKRPHATEADATGLYYLLGRVFYNMGDRREALYYFERVSKRDAGHRDVQRYLAQLRTRTAQ